MNPRTMTLMSALILIGIGLATTLWDYLRGDEPLESQLRVAVAARQIEPYTIITTDMLRAGPDMPSSQAARTGAWPVDRAVGKMSTDLIKIGTVLTGVNAKPVEAFRFAEDLDLEIVSFQAGTDRLVGGRLRPGHLINIYGYGRDEATRRNRTELIESRVWVVQVSQGGRALNLGRPQPDLEDGTYREIAPASGAGVATMITVAVEPRRAAHLIDALGANGLSAWVTLSASEIAAYQTATPPPDSTATAPRPTAWFTPPWMPTVPIAGYGPPVR